MQIAKSINPNLALQPDRDVEVPPKKLPEDSRTSKVLALPVGGCYAESVRLPVEEQGWEKVQDARSAFQGWVGHVMSRAKSRNKDILLSSTVGEFRDRNGSIFVTAVITRIQ